MRNRFNRILIVRLSGIGDVINTLPALAVLRYNLPSSFIGWVVEDKAKDIVQFQKILNEVFIFRRQEWSPILDNPIRIFKAITLVPELIKKLRAAKFELAIDFQGNLKSGLITYLSGAKLRVGFEKNSVKEFNYIFTNYRVPLRHSYINRVERNFRLLEGLGLNTNLPADFIWKQIQSIITPADEEYFNSFFSSRINPQRPLVVFHPGTSNFGAFKRWPLANYAKLGDHLIETHKINLVITWGPGERLFGEEISRQMKHQPITDYHTNSLGRLARLLKEADLFVGSDSAPLHLAHLIGTRCIGLFGPKDPVIYGPYPARPETIIIRKELNCSPCTKRTCKKPDCMNLITPQEVFQSAEKLLYEK